MSAKKTKLALLSAGCVLLLALCAAAGLGSAARSATAGEAARAPDSLLIKNLLAEMATVELDSLPALPVERFALPDASVDVMRVRLEETYDIAGVGRDTVELKGWIAVMHDNPRPAAGETEVKWGTAISDTQFVGMDLRGDSKIFGPVQITLNPDLPSKGRVGKLDLPESELKALHNAYLVATGAQQEQKWKGGSDKVPAVGKGYEGIRDALQGATDAIEKQDPRRLLSHYDPSPNNTYFNGGAGKSFRGAKSYVDFLAPQFTKNKLDIKFNGLRVIEGVPGRWAVVEVTGTNTVVSNAEAAAGGEVPWHMTQVYVSGPRGAWVSKHDSWSVAEDPSALSIQGVSRAAGACRAEAAVRIRMPKLDLDMKTRNPVVWYSEVETIPPVGYTASISYMATPLISEGREVGTLTSGVVKFREVVRKVDLQGTGR